jgi:hypothetical protein
VLLSRSPHPYCLVVSQGLLAFLARCGTRTCPVLVHTAQYGPRPGHCADWIAAHSMCYVHSWMSYPSCHALTVLPACPTPVVLPRLSCPSCPDLVFMFPALFSRFPVFVVLFSLPCPICLVLHSLSSKSYTDCPVLAVQGSPYMADQKLKN